MLMNKHQDQTRGKRTSSCQQSKSYHQKNTFSRGGCEGLTENPVFLPGELLVLKGTHTHQATSQSTGHCIPVKKLHLQKYHERCFFHPTGIIIIEKKKKKKKNLCIKNKLEGPTRQIFHRPDLYHLEVLTGIQRHFLHHLTSSSGRAGCSESWLQPQKSSSSNYSTAAQAQTWKATVLMLALKEAVSIIVQGLGNRTKGRLFIMGKQRLNQERGFYKNTSTCSCLDMGNDRGRS